MPNTKTIFAVAAILSVALLIGLQRISPSLQQAPETSSQNTSLLLDEAEVSSEIQEQAVTEQQAEKTQQPAQTTEPLRRNLSEKVDIELVNLEPWKFAGKNSVLGGFGNQAIMKLKLINQTNKTVSAVQGTIVFRDIFGDLIVRHRFEYLGGIPANGFSLIDEQFSQHNYETVTTTTQYGFSWSPDTIVYQDGTKDSK